MSTLNIALRPLVDRDIDVVRNWLSQEHVRRWYGDPNEWLREISARDGEFAFIRHLIACEAGEAIGFCQYYRCKDSGEAEYEAYWQHEAYSIDYLIGAPDYVGRGAGKALVGALVGRVFAETRAGAIVVQPDFDNSASRATLVANGFAHDREHDVFVKWR